jgi:hypothetical protein
LRQNGPPGWTKRTSSAFPVRRYMRIPALDAGIVIARLASVCRIPQYFQL